MSVTWPVAEAKARFSELLDTCLAEGPQTITRRGQDTAVLVPLDEWRRLRDANQPTLKALLSADDARFDLDLSRGGLKRRPAEAW